MHYGTSKPPFILWVLLIAYLLFALVHSPNFWLSIPVFLYPILIYHLFWLNGQPNIIFWGLIFQWLNVSAQLLYSTILGISMADYMFGQVYPVQLFDKTIFLSIISLYFYSFGLFWAVKSLVINNIDTALEKYSPRNILRWYIIVSLIIYFSKAAIWALGSLVQYVYFFFYIKWGFFLVTFYVIHKKAPQLRWILYSSIAAESILGLSSFFADSFINILIFSLFGILTLKPKIKLSSLFILLPMAFLLFNIMVYWTASKQQYRLFLNKGEASQTVMVSQSDALTKLKEIVNNVDEKAYNNAIRAMVDRVGYVQYFDACIGYVPSVVPHQNGAVYAKAISHYLVPRFLNPNKEVLDDSKHTNQFTGLGLSDSDSATSFSLGSVADAYIDFGEIFMHLAMYFFGYFMGWCFSYLWRKSPNQLWAWILTGAFYLLIPVYGADTTKAIGFILIYFVTILIVKNRLIRLLDIRMIA